MAGAARRPGWSWWPGVVPVARHPAPHRRMVQPRLTPRCRLRGSDGPQFDDKTPPAPPGCRPADVGQRHTGMRIAAPRAASAGVTSRRPSLSPVRYGSAGARTLPRRSPRPVRRRGPRDAPHRRVCRVAQETLFTQSATNDHATTVRRAPLPSGPRSPRCGRGHRRTPCFRPHMTTVIRRIRRRPSSTPSPTSSTPQLLE